MGFIKFRFLYHPYLIMPEEYRFFNNFNIFIFFLINVNWVDFIKMKYLFPHKLQFPYFL